MKNIKTRVFYILSIVVLGIMMVGFTGDGTVNTESTEITNQPPGLEVEMEGVLAETPDGNFYTEPALLKIYVKDENFNPERLVYDCKVYQYDQEGNKIEAECAIDSVVSSWEQSEDRWILQREFSEDFYYEVDLSYSDDEGNKTEQKIEFAIDQSGPKIHLGEVKGEGANWEKYEEYPYISQDSIIVFLSASDYISKVKGIQYTLLSSDGEKEEGYIEYNSLAKTVHLTEEIPVTKDFKGRISLKAVDYAGNVSEEIETEGLIVASSQKHKEAGKAEIILSTKPVNEVAGVKYYNQKVKGKIRLEDAFSGLQSYSFIVGKNTEKEKLSSKNKILWNLEKTFSIPTEDGSGSSKENPYILSLSLKDNAGYETDTSRKLVIDDKNPMIDVIWSGGEVHNERYYGKGRIAKIIVTEKNFNEQDIIWNLKGEGVKVSGWSHNGDKHYCEVSFLQDGEYNLGLSVTDYAMNQAAYDSGSFIIDTEAPNCVIGGVENLSANNGRVQPEITYSDANLSKESVRITLEGAKNGVVKYRRYPTSQTELGYKEKWLDFARKERIDDIYTLTVSMEDKAGNRTEQTRIFSVNRFGSTYELASGVKKLVHSYYVNREQSLTITEVNADMLIEQEIHLKRDNDVAKRLKEGVDYKVYKKINSYGWQQYRYVIDKSVFEKEGRYVVTLYSKDQAGNEMSSLTENQKIEFVVDKTAPAAFIIGLEDYRYDEEKHEITLHMMDDYGIESAVLYVNGEKYQSYAEKDLQEPGQGYKVVMKASEEEQSLYLELKDKAGNVRRTDTVSCLIGTDKTEETKRKREEESKEQDEKERTDSSGTNAKEAAEDNPKGRAENVSVKNIVLGTGVAALVLLLLALILIFS